MHCARCLEKCELTLRSGTKIYVHPYKPSTQRDLESTTCIVGYVLVPIDGWLFEPFMIKRFVYLDEERFKKEYGKFHLLIEKHRYKIKEYLNTFNGNFENMDWVYAWKW